jgi:hypothetical protein
MIARKHATLMIFLFINKKTLKGIRVNKQIKQQIIIAKNMANKKIRNFRCLIKFQDYCFD